MFITKYIKLCIVLEVLISNAATPMRQFTKWMVFRSTSGGLCIAITIFFPYGHGCSLFVNIKWRRLIYVENVTVLYDVRLSFCSPFLEYRSKFYINVRIWCKNINKSISRASLNFQFCNWVLLFIFLIFVPSLLD